MSASVLAGGPGLDVRAARPRRWVREAVVVVGATFVAEAVASVFVDSHVGYHALNVVLNGALLVVATAFALAGRRAVGTAGVVGGWATSFMALLAATGGTWAVLVEAAGTAESPGWVEGIAHTAVLASLLFLVPFGLGLRRVARVAALVIAGSSACLVVMVLAGLDQPELFLVPEAGLGFGWLLLSRSLRAPDADHR